MSAQDRISVTGEVTDAETGMPVPGANVVQKGTANGVLTDFDGNFIITVPENATLQFSFLGFPTVEVEVGGRTELEIQLTAKADTLEEVVVVGYGTQKKSVVTGAISSVDAEDLENQQIGRLEQALQGRTSGLTIASSSGSPGAESTVTIRGATSLNPGANSPLYVVDGVVVGGSNVDFLSPNDIASIEILKDAASAAIYGARSSAGVILITTKKGQKGGIQFSYDGYVGTQSPDRKLDLLNSEQYATLINEQSLGGGGGIIIENPQSLGEGTNWQDLIFNDDARIQNHQISISGEMKFQHFILPLACLNKRG